MRVDNEAKRINAVNRFKNLDAGILQQIKQLVELVADICNTPLATFTLLDKDTEWIKASKGIDIKETRRLDSLCNYTIQQDDVIIIPDLTADVTYSKNPFVIQEPYVRFYAGAPLITKDNHAIGSLCVIDLKIRSLNNHQINSLKTLAMQVINLMELNDNFRALQAQYEKTREKSVPRTDLQLKLKAMFDCSADVHMLVNKNFNIMAYNRSAVEFVKNVYKHKLAYGDCVLNITDNRILNQFKKYFNIALSGRSIKREWLLMAGTPRQCWHSTAFVPVKNHEGQIVGISLNSTDITHRKIQEERINIQNEALQRIAIIQSHELRRPVATLLGIIDLIRMENVPFSYYDIMEHTINELDEKIRDIVKDSEQTLNTCPIAIID